MGKLCPDSPGYEGATRPHFEHVAVLVITVYWYLAQIVRRR
jgi:hypothetical protein